MPHPWGSHCSDLPHHLGQGGAGVLTSGGAPMRPWVGQARQGCWNVDKPPWRWLSHLGDLLLQSQLKAPQPCLPLPRTPVPPRPETRGPASCSQTRLSSAPTMWQACTRALRGPSRPALGPRSTQCRGRRHGPELHSECKMALRTGYNVMREAQDSGEYVC